DDGPNAEHRLLRLDLPHHPLGPIAPPSRRLAVCERHVAGVVLDAVEVVAGPELRLGRVQGPLPLELDEPSHRRRLALAEISEDQTEVLLDGIAPDPHPLRERRI